VILFTLTWPSATIALPPGFIAGGKKRSAIKKRVEYRLRGGESGSIRTDVGNAPLTTLTYCLLDSGIALNFGRCHRPLITHIPDRLQAFWQDPQKDIVSTERPELKIPGWSGRLSGSQHPEGEADGSVEGIPP
jgi:hypothetical protein